MSSAAEARFRVQAPNSKPRAIKVVALDAASEAVVQRLSGGEWTRATFLTAKAEPGVSASEAGLTAAGWLRDTNGAPHDLMSEVDSADLVIMVATAGGDAHTARLVGQACSLRRVNTTGLIVGAASASDEALASTLAQLRPWSLMVVIAQPDDYIDDMLTALRA